MATTTNYGWTTPDDTDLVKDGAAAIRTLGSSVDTTTKNLNPETTLGDMSFRSATSNVNTRLPIGSSGQHLTVVAGVPAWATASDQTPLTTKGDLFTFSTVDARLGVGANGTTLVADSSEATGLKWQAPASGAGLVLINTTSFSGVSSQSINSVFSSTYDNYRIIMNIDSSVSSVSCRLRLRVSGSDNSSSNYVFDAINPGGGGTASITTTAASPETSWQFVASGGITSALSTDIYYPFATNNTGITQAGFYIDSSAGTSTDHRATFRAGASTVTTSYDGFTFFPDSGTMTGAVSVYGYAK